CARIVLVFMGFDSW
nr:immunoglobulin heavy chain junction region [Macaca mulatta]